MKDKVTDIKRDRESDLVVAPSPNGYNGQSKANVRQGTGSFLLVSHVECRGLRTWAVLYCFLRLLAGSSIQSGIPGTEQAPNMDAGSMGRDLMCHNLAPAPIVHLLSSSCSQILTFPLVKNALVYLISKYT